MSTLITILIQALISLGSKLLSESMFEEVLRRATFHLLDKIVKSTKNTVDDDIVEPILSKLKEPHK